MSLPIVAVVDTGVDDALALVVAARHPAVDLRGVVCTAGNVPLPRVLANTQYVLDLIGAKAPVAVGAAHRLDGGRFGDRSVHGPDGLAGLGPPDAPTWLRVVGAEPRNTAGPAVVRLDKSGEIAVADLVTPDTFVVSLGPLTPLVGVPAGRIVASYSRRGEANYEMDPAAAEAVAVDHADVPDHPVPITPGEGPVGELVRGLLRHQRHRGAGLGDAAVMLHIAEPDLDRGRWARRLQTLAARRD
ncbi:MAG TPA: nucleoside hydrolase [Jiangellaceae bacterium]|nr:nucleoside hydrolase [Jiangellaceae bacterium]